MSYYVHTSPFLQQEEEVAYQQREQVFYAELAQAEQQKQDELLLVALQHCRQTCTAAHLVKEFAPGQTRVLHTYRASSLEDGSNRKAGRSKQRVSRSAYTQSIPKDWRGTASTKMRLLVDHVLHRLAPGQKMLIVSSYIQSLLIAEQALLQNTGVCTLVLANSMSQEGKAGILSQFLKSKKKTVLLLSCASIVALLTQRRVLRVSRILILDSDWDFVTEQAILRCLLQRNEGVMTRLLIESSLELQLYLFLKWGNRKRKRGCKSMRICNYHTVQQILPMSDLSLFLQPQGDEELSHFTPPVQEEEEEPEQVMQTPPEEDAEAESEKERMFLIHTRALPALHCIPVGVCLFGLTLNHKITYWHPDPLFLWNHMFDFLQESCLLQFAVPLSASWLTTQSFSLTFCILEKPMYRQRLPASFPHSLLPEQFVPYYGGCYSPLPLDSSLLLYFDYFQHYYSAYNHTPFLPSSLFPSSGLLPFHAPEEEETQTDRPWQLPSPSHLLHQLFFELGGATLSTSLLLALLYRDTDQHHVYYYQEQPQQPPLLFYHTTHTIRMVSCGTKKMASAALCHALQGTTTIHVPLFFGTDWLDSLTLPGISILSRRIQHNSGLCYYYEYVVEPQCTEHSFSEWFIVPLCLGQEDTE